MADETVALLCNEIGFYLRAMDQLDDARPFYERTLDIRERVLGADHPHTGTSVWWVGVIAEQVGDVEVAKRHYRRSLTIFEEALGPGHSRTEGVRGFLARLGEK